MEITGKIIVVCPAKSGVSQRSGNPWKSQEYVLETEGAHSEKCVFSVFGEDKINEFGLRENDLVSVSINLDAKEYNGRWFNSLQAWRVMKAQAANNTPQSQPEPAPTKRETPQTVQFNSTIDDDMPF